MPYTPKLSARFPASRCRGPRPWMVPLLAALAVPTLAWALAGSPFEGADGDLVTAGGVDWVTLVGSPRLVVGADLPSGQTDDSLRGKEDDVVPGIDYGSIPNNKSDLLRFYVSHDRVSSGGSAHDFLYLAWVRADTLGTANMDFEFNRNKCDATDPTHSVCAANGVTPARSAGDILITYDFDSGGGQIDRGLAERERGERDARDRVVDRSRDVDRSFGDAV